MIILSFCLFLPTAAGPGLVKSDSRADVLAENSDLASGFIKTLFGVLYEVYSSSVSIIEYNSKLLDILQFNKD